MLKSAKIQIASDSVTAQEQDMNAPPNVDSVTSDSVVYWLTNDTRDERFLDNIFAELCVRLQRAAFLSSGRRFIC